MKKHTFISAEDVIEATLDIRNSLNFALSHAADMQDAVTEDLLLEATKRIDDLWALCNFRHGFDYVVDSTHRKVHGEFLGAIYYKRRSKSEEGE